MNGERIGPWVSAGATVDDRGGSARHPLRAVDGETRIATVRGPILPQRSDAQPDWRSAIDAAERARVSQQCETNGGFCPASPSSSVPRSSNREVGTDDAPG